MKQLIALGGLFFLLGTLSVTAQDIFGKWKTIDDETGKEKSIVEIYEKGGRVYGKVVEILNKEKLDAKCDKCNGDKKGQPILGMVIIEGLEKDGNTYSGGSILDPNKGKEYRCKLWVDESDPDKLNVRGYVAFFYRTQNWFRVQ
ncbi:DUF2147 domain-containing protein [Sinomicrobium pectinilyticum]|uniref:DUF2147 domain-containing protein n=1 Tax=Sinomicrobium pectinilyticum TaxID=1084421 RepID=A0A3N0DR61_SINP1|nr:DUF2147 domain-containing protein [Sinomicrobium pectinilyticum]RNL78107.1 DUF2147 domain-containing protein [Sinomicrobium pectinilyticum]